MVSRSDTQNPQVNACSVGAGLPAKNVNDNAHILGARGAWTFFASKLAPTEGGVFIAPSRSGRTRHRH
ncbi:hypothetical protein BZ164_15445 [Pseudomonas veronii]|nr:hypothetical protein BZ164_15445 [Pseudomonas veronii]